MGQRLDLRRAAASLAAVLASSCAPPAETAVTSPQASTDARVGGSMADAHADAGTVSGDRLVHVRILAINDFHGNLQPPAGSNGWIVAPPDDPAAPADAGRTDGGDVLIPTGGAAFLAAHLARLRQGIANSILVSAGDLTGASPLVSSLFGDRPTIDVMNEMGLNLEAVGNHDFDHGLAALQWLQHGGCASPPQGQPSGDVGCDAGAFGGAEFTYLAANVFLRDGGSTLFPAYVVKEWDGARVAFIGETLKGTPAVTNADAVSGLAFGDEADTANALIPEIQRQQVSAIVLILHQGAEASSGTYDSCNGLGGALLPILARLDPAIGIVVSGHTHHAYDCKIGGRLVTSAASYGRLVTAIDLALDPVARRIVDARARNVPVTRDVAPDPGAQAIVEQYAAQARTLADRVVGYVEADVTGNSHVAGRASCETPLGDLVADAMQAATGGEIAFMNAGGIRADLVAHRPELGAYAITYSDAYAIQPFGNDLVTMSLSGAAIRQLLARQYGRPGILQVSHGFSYRYAVDRAHGTIQVEDLRLRGRPLEMAKLYRVVVPSFLARGGDGYEVLASGRDPKVGPVDVQAFVDYLGRITTRATPLKWHPAPRVEGNACTEPGTR
jgi:5'-nucleotidase